MAYRVMAYIVMAYIVMARFSCGLYSYGWRVRRGRAPPTRKRNKMHFDKIRPQISKTVAIFFVVVYLRRSLAELTVAVAGVERGRVLFDSREKSWP